MALCGPVTAATCDLQFDNGVILNDVPVAATVEEQARGLSGVDSAGQGMLFTWPDSQPRHVWMKDTRILLSAGFIADDGELFRIVDMEPMTMAMHFSGRPATDMLELATGDFERHGLSVGSNLVRRSCDDSGGS